MQRQCDCHRACLSRVARGRGSAIPTSFVRRRTWARSRPPALVRSRLRACIARGSNPHEGPSSRLPTVSLALCGQESVIGRDVTSNDLLTKAANRARPQTGIHACMACCAARAVCAQRGVVFEFASPAGGLEPCQPSRALQRERRGSDERMPSTVRAQSPLFVLSGSDGRPSRRCASARNTGP